MTHTERVLELLADGEPHSHHEGYALNVMFHSRVADLRRQGYRIDCWRDGDLYKYRLRSPVGEPSQASGEKPAATGDGEAEAASSTAGDLEPGWLGRLLNEDDEHSLSGGWGLRAPSSSLSSGQPATALAPETQLSLLDEAAA